MQQAILGPNGRPYRVAPRGRRISAKYDVAQTTTDNTNYWGNTDSLSPDAANSLAVRKKLRERARYEVANNSYAKGMLLTLANDCVNVGPTLQMLSEDANANATVEAEWRKWTHAIRLPQKLRTMRMSRAQDGESFGLFASNAKLRTRVKLDLELVETDQITTPDLAFDAANAIDGIVFDELGDAVEYHMLTDHPGSSYYTNASSYDRVPAAFMVHLFRADRPGQHRGVPEITPALPLFAQLRRYTAAVIAAAETAADFAAVLQTDLPPSEDAYTEGEAFDVIDLEKRMATILPNGYKLGQIRAEQPSTSYGDFKRQLLNEIARCLNMPYNVAACDSSDYNYASGRLDHQTYDLSIAVDRSDVEAVVLDALFTAWLAEAVLIEDFLPQPFRMLGANIEHRWFWRNRDHVDPVKVAAGARQELQFHGLTLAEWYARKGLDWETQLRQRYRELDLERQLAKALPAPQEDSPCP